MASHIKNIKTLDDNFIIMLDSLKNIKDEGKALDKPENENMLNLAYVGDVIFDMYISDKLIRLYNGKKKISDINKIAQGFLCAKGQARLIENLIDENIFTEQEIEIYKHGRNAHSNTKSKNSSIVDYRKATGFEALLGFLFYSKDIDRIIDLLSHIKL